MTASSPSAARAAVDELKELLAGATPGRWIADHQEYGDEWWFGGSNGPGEVTVGLFVASGDGQGRADAALIAAAVNALPHLLAAIKAVDELADRIEDESLYGENGVTRRENAASIRAALALAAVDVTETAE